jgi:hypothetical protein
MAPLRTFLSLHCLFRPKLCLTVLHGVFRLLLQPHQLDFVPQSKCYSIPHFKREQWVKRDIGKKYEILSEKSFGLRARLKGSNTRQATPSSEFKLK